MSSSQAPSTAERRSNTRRGFFDPKHDMWVVKVFPGEFYVTRRSDEMLVTILGSCVTACIRDPKAGVGGMNHFMLPSGEAGDWGCASHALRYGNLAMEKLIYQIVKCGGRKDHLEVKLFGGGNVIESRSKIGTLNSQFVHEFLAAEGITPATSDLGGEHGRRIEYYPITGKARRKFLVESEDVGIAKVEQKYRENVIENHESVSEIEILRRAS